LWQYLDEEQHRAMTLIAALALFAILVLAAVVATAVTVRRDGYRRRPWCTHPAGPDGGLPWGPYRETVTAPWPW